MGDNGFTKTLDLPISKANLRIEAIGSIDELNSVIGLCYNTYHLDSKEESKNLDKIQEDLMMICSYLSGGAANIDEKSIEWLENEIDIVEDKLKVQKEFVKQRGFGCYYHLARTVCRRAERVLVRLSQEQSKIKDVILQYMNRLSDYMFVMARIANSYNDF